MNTYEQEWKCAYNPRTAMEEASRCLLCLDAPCTKMCPAGTDPGKFIRSIRFLNVEGAAETIRENNPLGAVCARVCPTERYCELGCSRSGIDRPIDIGGLQRYATDFEAATGMQVLEAGEPTGKSVAIVGSGPAGLAAAAILRQQGHAVDMYEQRSTPGGFLSHGIPAYRLPDDVVAQEIERILGLGVNLHCNVTVGEGPAPKGNELVSIEALLSDHDAVLVDPGFQKGFMLPIFEGNAKAELAIDFLDRVRAAKGMVELPENVLVIGGGDVAMDVCTSLKRLGVPQVTDVIYERSSEFLCSKEELDGAQKAGVTLIDGYVPTAATEGHVTFAHRFIDAHIDIDADLVILAVGQRADVSRLGIPVEFKGNESAQAGPATQNPRVFIAGDIMQGDKTVVWAVRKAKEAVAAMASVLEGGE